MDGFKRTPREMLRRLKEIKALDPASTPYRKILTIINKELILPITVAKVHAGQYVERVRPMYSGTDIWRQKKDLSYRNDIENIIDFGRANSPGKSMFYGAIASSVVSSPRITAIAETATALQGKNKGLMDDKLLFTVGKWLVKKDLIVSEMVFKKDAIEKMPEVRKAFEVQSERIMASHSLPEAKQCIAMLEFISEAMAKRAVTNADYKLSAGFAESIIKSGRFDGIMFQSVQTEYEGTNLALTTKAVDECLVLEEALIVSVEIRNKRVFINNIARTGILQPDQSEFEWTLMDVTTQEQIEHFFTTGELPPNLDTSDDA